MKGEAGGHEGRVVVKLTTLYAEFFCEQAPPHSTKQRGAKTTDIRVMFTVPCVIFPPTVCGTGVYTAVNV